MVDKESDMHKLLIFLTWIYDWYRH